MVDEGVLVQAIEDGFASSLVAFGDLGGVLFLPESLKGRRSEAEICEFLFGEPVAGRPGVWIGWVAEAVDVEGNPIVDGWRPWLEDEL